MINAFKRIKAIIWDYDGVHYSYKLLPSIRFFEEVKADIIIGILGNLSREDAIQMGAEGYKKYSDPVRIFAELAQQQGLDHVTIRRKIFEGCQSNLFNAVAKNYPIITQTDPETVAAFEDCASMIQHGMVTHSSVKHWAEPNLRLQGLLRFFNRRAMIGLDDVDYAVKHESVVGLQQSMDHLGVVSKETLFVEDTLRNLEYARQCFPDLFTAYIHDGQPLETLPSYVNVQFHHPKAVMQTIARAHRQQRQLIV